MNTPLATACSLIGVTTARLSRLSGVKDSVLKKYTRGECEPTVRRALAISDALRSLNTFHAIAGLPHTEDHLLSVRALFGSPNVERSTSLVNSRERLSTPNDTRTHGSTAGL